MNSAKIRLSLTEMKLVNNAGMILTKNAILKKANMLLANLQEKQQLLIKNYSESLPERITETTPKISKGENYQELPYQILDYPRVFDHQNIFAVRTMFWWGNFFSVTLHLSGLYKKGFEKKIIAAYEILIEKGFYFSINQDQWEHHFGEENYIPVSEMNKNEFKKSVREKSFIKIANKMSLPQWNNAEEILYGYFKQIIGMLA